MWPSRKPEPPAPPPVRYGNTELQVGDECVCVNDEPHLNVHQKLLVKGQTYKVRYVFIAGGNVSPAPDGYGGPWIRVEGIVPINDAGWRCNRFEKVVKREAKQTIVEKVKEPAGLNVEKEREGAY